jgi:hypothetical protein
MSDAHAFPARTPLRLLAGLALAPPTAVLFALGTYHVLWTSGMLSGGGPIDSTDAAAALAMGVGLIAVVMTGCALPLLAWLKGRGPLSLSKVLLLGAALGNAPFAIIVFAIIIGHPIRETLSGDIGRFWYGVPGALERITIGLVSGTASAAVYWLAGVRGMKSHRDAPTVP